MRKIVSASVSVTLEPTACAVDPPYVDPFVSVSEAPPPRTFVRFAELPRCDPVAFPCSSDDSPAFSAFPVDSDACDEVPFARLIVVDQLSVIVSLIEEPFAIEVRCFMKS